MNLIVETEIKKKKGTKKLTLVDVIIGKKIRELRTLKGYSQVKIAKAMGVTFQQFQKYECGINRICISRLLAICKYCNVNPSYFLGKIYSESSHSGLNYGMSFESQNENSHHKHDNNLSDVMGEEFNESQNNDIDNKELLSLIKLFNNIKDSTVRKKAISLLRVLANQTEDQ